MSWDGLSFENEFPDYTNLLNSIGGAANQLNYVLTNKYDRDQKQ